MSLSGSISPLLLVLCTGNMCRSPMAEVLFKYYIEKAGLDAVVISRGLAAPLGRAPHHHAVAIANSHGISLDPSKRAMMVTGAEVSMAEAIFIMDSEHRRDLQRRFPTVLGKTFLLGHWQALEILDPINEPMSTFERVWQQCNAGAASWVAKLKEVGIIKELIAS